MHSRTMHTAFLLVFQPPDLAGSQISRDICLLSLRSPCSPHCLALLIIPFSLSDSARIGVFIECTSSLPFTYPDSSSGSKMLLYCMMQCWTVVDLKSEVRSCTST